MFFSKKGKLRKAYDEKLALTVKATKGDFQNAKVIESLMDDYNLDAIAQRKAAESVHFYLYKEARIRRIILK